MVPCSVFRVQGLRLKVQCSGFKVQGSGSGFRVWVWVQDSGFRVQVLGLRVEGLKLRVEVLGLRF